MKKIKIIIIEDHTILRETLAGTLDKEKDFRIIGHWDDAESALSALTDLETPDVAVIDNILPGMTGIALVKIFQEKFPTTRTIILSMDTRDEEIFEAFEAGIMGYLPKVISIKELAEAIRSVSRGQQAIDQKITNKFLRYCSRFYGGTQGVPNLSDEQKTILEMAREGFSNQEIAEKLNQKLTTIKSKFRGICKKLGARDRTQAVIEAIKKGILTLES